MHVAFLPGSRWNSFQLHWEPTSTPPSKASSREFSFCVKKKTLGMHRRIFSYWLIVLEVIGNLHFLSCSVICPPASNEAVLWRKKTSLSLYPAWHGTINSWNISSWKEPITESNTGLPKMKPYDYQKNKKIKEC